MNWKRRSLKKICPGRICLGRICPGRICPGSFFLAGILMFALGIQVHSQVNLRYEQNETVSWEEAIEMYKWLDESYEEAILVEAGMTDAGKPLHLFIISGDQHFSPEQSRKAGKTILFINNGIHPGEPCGIDASLKLASGLLSGSDSYAEFLESTTVVIVPVFNVGGALNRGKYHRANQNGPIEHGFRGNARNLDLNRDFIKLDSRNTLSLTSVLRDWEPDLFVDTHTSNGADYPYVLTLINSHEQRHQPAQAAFLEEELKPFLFESMRETPYEMSPYVWSYRKTPDNGIISFIDYPRYTSGYTSLYNTLSFTVETHMFKPFRDRVLSTWHLLREMLRFTNDHGEKILAVKDRAWEEKMASTEFVLQWDLDTSRFDMISFKGYSAKSKTSRVSGQEVLWYDRSEQWEKEIPYYRYFKARVSTEVPEYYILPYAWGEVIERLKMNKVEMMTVKNDTIIEVEVSYIDSYETSERPYNGHYYHRDVKLRKSVEHIKFSSGDLIIPTRQEAREYLVQTLDPRGYDSFFSWNFFDEILFRNEYFSPYIFEESAWELLQSDEDLAKNFNERKESDSAFAASSYQQLRYIYENSPWSEPTYMRYPVYRSIH